MDKEIEKRIEDMDLSLSAPMEEPYRQYYYIKKAGICVKHMEESLGRPLTCRIATFGCQMNARDSEKLLGILREIGYRESESEETADFILYNTCTVRENANTRIYGRLGYLHTLKKKNPRLMIALCGCMMQEPEEVARIQTAYRFVDIVFGTHNIYKLAQLLCCRFESDRMIVDVLEDSENIVEELPNRRKYSFKSGVNIMFGCNNFCSYCIVPYVRGRERSRSPREILREMEKLAADGVVEVMLLGQNVNSYGKDLESPMTFARLLQEAEKIPGISRIRFMTPHPKDLSDELIDVMAASEKICRHVHLPLQSGSTRILEKMNRKYTKEHYLALVEKIRKAMPDVALTTDIIVGFPGEREEDFRDTLDVVQKCGYDSAYTFIYSRRSGTPAALMEDRTDAQTIKERFERLLRQIRESSEKNVGRLTGTVQKVLAEEINEQDSALITGRLENNTLVHFKGGKEVLGKILSVRLTEAKGFYYMGEREMEY